MALARPDVEFVRPGLEAPLKGVAALREWMEPDAFAEQWSEPLHFLVSGNKVLGRQRTRARGAGSGIELDLETWVIWTLDDDGLVARGEVYSLDQEVEARRAAGLSEGDVDVLRQFIDTWQRNIDALRLFIET